ncbi:formate dehydrogenase accessory sulfurtransferase FdhD [Colwellia sp. E2M01]|uniref:formate dehydrogenase accessory sulfurtransferase FdhD n=1 Tax=Colwellia sp. E2M01 TaxID=2841561 RepID=UPI001C09855B|nr:formate dehydrogenase accessory sulfurtransferase FdhD [Colwellia sp. E2M01]MBU2872056.1 formate dehydrogenase accessory sulfurtransferase FdhD [Colwellia sp. E2M01]
MSITEHIENDLHQATLHEAAVSISINGISHAVMMASPTHLKDFALGFVLSEGLITAVSEVLNIVVHSHECGWQVDLQVLARTQYKLKQRRRSMAGPSGCGLCGIDSLEAAMALNYAKNTISPTESSLPTEDVIMQAKSALPDILKKSGGIRGNHCAAYFDLVGNIIAFREDVGRHSALDKLLGFLSKEQQVMNQGFAIITSRCSHDLIAKAARLHLSTLVTLSQPTDLAVRSARETGLALFCFQYGQLKRFA